MRRIAEPARRVVRYDPAHVAFEKPATRVVASPKPTQRQQHDRAASSIPQN